MPCSPASRKREASCIVLALAVSSLSTPSVAQSPANSVWWGVHGVVAATTLDPAPGTGDRTEIRAEQTMVMLGGRALGGHLRASAILSLEKLTSEDGILGVGAWGNGFYDRRHPHDYLHEAILSLAGDIGPEGSKGRIGLAAGKGTVPFGAEPAMLRPPLHGPVNHHWTEIMDRWLVSANLRLGFAGLELTFFDNGGKTPSEPADTGNHHTFACSITVCTGHPGISRSARLTVPLVDGVEVLGALATLVGTGGHHAGAGDGRQAQWYLGSRVERPVGPGRIRILLEVAEADAERTFGTFLAEGALSTRDRKHRIYYRFERTDRPEGPRATDPFRAGTDTLGAPVGLSRWTVHTVGYGVGLIRRGITVEPVVELSAGRMGSVGTPVVNLEGIYGRRTVRSVVVGIRVSAGAPHAMGQYGADGPHPGHH